MIPTQRIPLLGSYLALTLSAILYGFLVFGGKLMNIFGFSLIEILIIPNLIVACFLSVCIKPEFRKFYSVPFHITLLYFLAIVLGQIGQFAPIFMGLSVSLTVFLLYTQPLWTTLISIFVLKRLFSLKDAFLIITMFIGLIFLLAPWRDVSFSFWGVILALIGGISMSGWIIINESFYIKKNFNPLSITFFTNIYQSIPFILAVPFLMYLLPDPAITGISFDKSIGVYGFVFVYALSVFIGAQLLFYKAAKKINSIHLGMVLLLEPVIATILDVTFLKTPITWNLLVGGFFILGANAYLIIQSARKEK